MKPEIPVSALLPVGLCLICRYEKIHRSAKGSTFVLCQRAKTDVRLSKYPVLPVLDCVGFEQETEDSG